MGLSRWGAPPALFRALPVDLPVPLKSNASMGSTNSGTMSYALVDLEITRPLPPVNLGLDESGVGVLLRKNDRPIGFFLVPLRPGAQLDNEGLRKLIIENAGVEILRTNVLDEITGVRRQPSPLDLTVAVCTRDRPRLLESCLASILRLRDADSCWFEVLVTDNAPSNDDTRDLVRTLPDVKYFREPRPGLDFARNRAVQEVTTDTIAFVDDDAIVDRGWVLGLRKAWDHDPRAAAVAGLVLPYELATEAQIRFEQFGGFRRGFQTVRFAGQYIDRNKWYPTWPGLFGTGCNMAFRADSVRALGGFDEALDTGPPLPGGGDLDMFYRVVRAGHSLVYEPQALVFHRHRRELHALRHQYWTWGTSFMAFLHKTYRREPEMRPRIRRTVSSWFWGGTTELAKALRHTSPLSADLVMAQLGGGLLTLPWMYPRSSRRARRIRRLYTPR